MSDSLFGIEGLSELGWEVPDDLERDAFIENMKALQKMENVGPWAIGDGMLQGVMRFGDEAWQALGLQYEEKTVNRMMRACEDFPIYRRKPGVSLWKAEVMRRLPEEIQDHLMTVTSEESLTLDEINRRVGSFALENQEKLDHENCPFCGSNSYYWTSRPPMENIDFADNE